MNKKLMCIIALAALLASCSGRMNKYMYFQDLELDTEYAISEASQTVIRVDDRLGISVDCKNRELALPFNNKSASYNVSLDGESLTTGEDGGIGYRVGNEGYISFPMIGKIKLAGLTLTEAAAEIENAIIKGGYIKDPTVTIEFLNARYIILGEAGSGVYPMQGDKITLLEALAKSGDIGENARLDRIMVIREVDGVRKTYMNDIRTKDIFDSPCYYLQQNDIIYVQPRSRTRQDVFEAASKLTALLGSVASIVSLYFIYERFGASE